MSSYLGDPRQDAITYAMKSSNTAKFKLLMLLVKLNLYPCIVYAGEVLPASRYSPEYGRFFYGSAQR